MPYAASSQRHQLGFTLLEVLVALLVFGFLSAGLANGFRVGLAAWDIQNTRRTSRNDFVSVDRSLRDLLSRTSPGGLSDDTAPFRGSSQSMTFVTTLPKAASGLSWNEVDMTLNVSSDHDLQLLWTPRYRTPIGPPPSRQKIILRSEIDRLDLAYWQDANAGWQASWTARTLPKLIRIRVVSAARSRPWPDLVVAPMRDRWRQ
ncbi:MAG: prepilin-type N-terminal cleavage/methylation domain-containing protein [Rhodospirillales bacterium]|nr:prepilin-type N-terminal cleavage/methylation domain-containing protein [Acetobacter sp.]